MRPLGGLLAAVVVGLLVTGCSTGRATPPAEERPLVGLLRVIPDEDQEAFVDELHAQGWADVDVVPDDPGSAVSDPEDARGQLEEWVADGVDLIVASSTPYAAIAAEVAPTLPVLFLVNDPVAAGLVSDPSHPEGKLTGVTFRTPADRTIDLAAQVMGRPIERVGYLAPTGDRAVDGHRAGVVDATEELGLGFVEAGFDGPEGVPAAVAELAAADVDIVYLASSNSTVAAIDEIETALAEVRLPVVASTDFIDFALLIVAPDSAEVRRQLARQAARILSGADIASVPVEDPRRFVSIVDRGVAARLGLPPVPPEVLRKMDVVR